VRLQDAIIAARPLVVEGRDGARHSLPGAADVAQRLALAPVRYVLDDASAALVTRTAFAEDTMLEHSLDLLRFPSTAFWIEWDDRGRAAFLKKHGLADPQAGSAKGRAGALVTADASGRRGEISMIWENEAGEADLAPFAIEFDLGDPEFFAARDGKDWLCGVGLRHADMLNPLYQRARFRLAAPWLAYISRYAQTQARFDATIQTHLLCVSGDLAFISAFCLLLSARGALHYRSSDLDRLNAARRRKDHRPLLEHVTVSLDLSSDPQQSEAGGVSPRAAPRLHHVCGHLVRRSDALHWRRSHLRGNPRAGMISARTIEVRAAGRVC
jgi:hypothetical protein